MTAPGLEAYDPSRFITDGVYTPDFTVPTDYEVSLSKQVAQVFLTSVVAAKVLDWSKLGQQWGKSGFNHQSFAEQVGASFISGFQVTLTGLLLEGAMHGGSQLGEVAGLALHPKVAQAWAQVYAHQVAVGAAVTSAKAIEDMVNQGVNQRLPGPAMVERAQAIYGLDAQSANTYSQWATQKALPKGTNLLEVAATLLVRRAKTIGDVNTFTSINQGHQLAYMQGVQDGKIDQDARKVWVTALDERVCPICKPMDGIAVPLNDAFEVQMPLPKTGRGKNRQSTSVVTPPVHPNCRCTIVLEPTFLAGLITRTARYKDDDHHKASLFSSVEDLILQKRYQATETRDASGRWAKVGAHLNAVKSVSSVTAEMKHGNVQTLMLSLQDLASESPKFTKLYQAHVMDKMRTGSFMEMNLAVVDDAMNTGDSTAMEAFAAEANTRTLNAFRDPEIQKMLVRMSKRQATSVSANHILNSSQYALANHPEFNPRDVHLLTRGAEVWSNTVTGRDAVRKAASLPRERLGLYGKSLMHLVDAVDQAPATAPVLYRGISLDDYELLNWEKGKTFNLDLSSFSSDKSTAVAYSKGGRGFRDARLTGSAFEDPLKIGKPHKVVFVLDPGAKALHISPLAVQTSQAEWITRGQFVVRDMKVVSTRGVTIIKIARVAEKVIKTVGVPDDDALLIALNSPLPKPDEEIAKYIPRDALGRFAAVAGAGAAVAGAGAYAFNNIGSDKAAPIFLPRHLKRVDAKVKSARSGVYFVPRQYLDFHRRGLSFRFGQEQHVNALAREMKSNGYKQQPITLHVYDDAVDVADGNHRVQAANLAKIGYVPTRIVRFKGNKPVKRGVLPAIREQRSDKTREAVRNAYLLNDSRRSRLAHLNSRLISQDEKKQQWHIKRPRTIKPL